MVPLRFQNATSLFLKKVAKLQTSSLISLYCFVLFILKLCMHVSSKLLSVDEN